MGNVNKEKHHDFSPSSFERRVLCPASYKLEKDLPDVETEDAKAGTFYHEEIHEYYCTNEMPHSNEAFDAVEYVEAHMPEHYKGHILEVLPETPLVCTDDDGTVLYTGRADAVYVHADKNSALVVDYKFGHNEVTPAENNYQLAMYALAVHERFKVKVVDVMIVNPVIHQYSAYTFGMVHFAEIKRRVKEVITACKADNAPCVMGDSQCKYCKASVHGTCPALNNAIAIMSAVKPAPAYGVDVPNMLTKLTDVELLSLKEKCDIIGKLSKAVDARVKELCEENGSCGGYRLKEVSGGRTVDSIYSAYMAVSKVMTEVQFIGCCDVSIPSLEVTYADILKVIGEVKTLKEGKEKFAEAMGDVLVNKPPRKMLTRI